MLRDDRTVKEVGTMLCKLCACRIFVQPKYFFSSPVNPQDISLNIRA